MSTVRALPGRLRRRARRTLRGVRESVAGAQRRVPARAVALTFDDGPHPASTAAVLDVLAELDVPATFFCVGRNAAAHPGLVRRALAGGHAVGSHSMTHPHPARSELRTLTADYRDGHRAVEDAAEREVRLFRPPHGHLSLVHAAVLRRLDLPPWLWTVDPRDWRPGVPSPEIVRVCGAAGPGDVVLLHDWIEQPLAPEAEDRTATIRALRQVVGAVRERGLGFTTLPG